MPLHIRTLSSLQRHHFYARSPLSKSHAASTSTDPCYSLLAFCCDVNSLPKAHALLVVRGLVGDLLLWTKLLSSYGSLGHVTVARNLFDEIPYPDFYSWKVMLRWYFLCERYSDVVYFRGLMRGSGKDEHDDIVVSIMLKACSELQSLEEGRKLHSYIVKAGSRDSFVFSGLIDMYAKCGKMEFSRGVFDELEDNDNIVSWTSMISGYVQNGCEEDGLDFFNRMREGSVRGNQHTYASLVAACMKLGALHQGKWLHGQLIKNGIDVACNSFLVTCLLDMYAKCGEVADARKVFNELLMPDLVSWTAMIVGYTQSGAPHMALELFTDEKWEGISPNSVTIAALLSACAQLENLWLGMSIHGLEIKLGSEDKTVLNALLDMYAKCRVMESARRIFNYVDKKDVVAWNSMISGLVQNGFPDEAVELFHQMRLDSVSPDPVTVVVALSACASLGAFQIQFGSAIHAFSIKEGFSASNIYVGTAVLNFYAKCGDMESARSAFDSMDGRNTITWSAMISGYGMQGDATGSFSLFGDMLKEELLPTEVIFTTILSACRHTGLITEGLKFFNLMRREYYLLPSMKHYSSMVDLLSRAGRLEEALEFIQNMPMKPEISMFGAFLHGCSLYSRFDLGEVAIRKMQELHTEEACYYVLISNTYASDGRWIQVNQIRELMEGRRLIKAPGRSLLGTHTNSNVPPRLDSQLWRRNEAHQI